MISIDVLTFISMIIKHPKSSSQVLIEATFLLSNIFAVDTSTVWAVLDSGIIPNIVDLFYKGNKNVYNKPNNTLASKRGSLLNCKFVL